MALELRGLYAITPETTEAAPLFAGVEAALAGGCRLLQFRDKSSPMSERLARGRVLRVLTRRHGAQLIVNDDLALAALLDADGVHLGSDDGNLGAARAILGPQKILGASCYADLDAARAAQAAGADYVAFGAAFASPTKPDAAHAPLALYAQAKAELATPICAIGGITATNAAPLIDAGVDLLAIITNLFSAPDIAARAAQYQRLFEKARP